RLLFGLLALLLYGCSAQQATPTLQSDAPPQTEEAPMPKTASLPDLGPAPELTNDIWLNVDSPLRLADLRGKVVIVEMWTFGCYNCKNVIPSLKEWHNKYADLGLVIIGNHYPEFSYERDLENVKKAVADYGIEYAVAQDNDGVTWRAYKNRYWPALYLIDKQGHIRYVHFGEGRYQETEENIQALLAEEYIQ
ncbi:MAG: redoxin domain-containing protein, partial [Anaerolineales bacterium]|nr:redoxin domain-containing protein [Anaerolineales bacterium]